MPAYVYILASQKNGTLYTGSTTDLSRRMEEHREMAIDGFTAKYGVTRMVFAEEHPTTISARQQERQIKKWKRAWKIELIECGNPHWEDLAKLGRLGKISMKQRLIDPAQCMASSECPALRHGPLVEPGAEGLFLDYTT